MRKETTLERIELQRNEEIILAEGATRRERRSPSASARWARARSGRCTAR